MLPVMRVATPETWYETKALDDGVTHIWEPYIKPFYRCNIWHIRGRDRDVLLDSGMGVVSLRARVAALAERPLLAVASHTHFDHIGSHHEFAERAVHRAEADILAAPSRDSSTANAACNTMNGVTPSACASSTNRWCTSAGTSSDAR